jgi:hypothetical protein
MTTLSPSQIEILELIGKHDGEWNWYKVSRAKFDLFVESPELRSWNYVADGLVREQVVEGEPLPRLFLTDAGKNALMK